MTGADFLLGSAASREKSLSRGFVDGKCYNFSGGEMDHYHIYRPLEFPLGSGLVESYSRVSIYFESRRSAHRYAKEYDGGTVRAMVKTCTSTYCDEVEAQRYADEE